ncbi:YihY/virulence factor BrkB family protein [Roseococcus sp. DSY-14]|uniref:YihY/virulence factor BrkB family protein n=1 Tax=Roseococcus sp. DSY-14 TaxID=3369650 RepID=UPI00387ADA7F
MSDLALAEQRRPGVWRRAWAVATSDKISLTSAGCAFYAMLALFPALSLLVTVYGLWFDPVTVEPQLDVLRRVVPESTFFLIAGRVHDLVSQPRPTLGAKFLVSLAIALWSASSGIRAMMGALNLAHSQAEERGVLAYYGTAFGVTLGAVVAVAVGIALLVGLPKVLDLLELDVISAFLVRFASMTLLLGFVLVAISVLYRFGPAHPPEGWRLFGPGAVSATVLWAAGSSLFSLYVGNFAGYDATYGALGAAVALLMWFYVSTYVILLGAELDAEIARSGG